MRELYLVKIDENTCKRIIDNKYRNCKIYNSKLTQCESMFIGYDYETELRYIVFFHSDEYKKISICDNNVLLSLDKETEYNGDHSILYKEVTYGKLDYYVGKFRENILRIRFKIFSKSHIIKKLDYDDILEIFSEYYIDVVLREKNIFSSSAMSFVDENGKRCFAGLFASNVECVEDIMIFSLNAYDYLKNKNKKYSINTVTQLKQPW